MSDYSITANDVDVYVNLSGGFTSSSTPTNTQVDAFVSQREGELHLTLKRLGVNTPLTDNDDINMAKGYIIKAAAADAWIAAYDARNLPTYYSEMLDQWREFLKAILDGEVDFNSDQTDGPDDPSFLIVRPIVRDSYFSRHREDVDYDE